MPIKAALEKAAFFVGFVERIFASDGVIRRFDDGFVYVDVFPIAVINWKGFGMGWFVFCLLLPGPFIR